MECRALIGGDDVVGEEEINQAGAGTGLCDVQAGRVTLPLCRVASSEAWGHQRHLPGALAIIRQKKRRQNNMHTFISNLNYFWS